MADRRTQAEKKNWSCLDCGKDCIKDDKDYYMIQHELWMNLVGSHEGMLCMNCLETRLGHKLRKEEILSCPLTEWMNPYTAQILKS